MRKDSAFIKILILFVLIFSPLQTYSQEITIKGLQWLTSVQKPDGFWGDLNGPIFRNTTVVADTFQILEPTSTVYFTALEWLAIQDPANYDYISRRIYTLSNTSYNFSLDLNNLISGQNSDGGWGLYTDHESDPLTTTLALQSFRAINYTDWSVLSSALNYLTGTQNPDSGWGFYQGDRGNVYMTAVVLVTLSEYKGVYYLEIPINKAVDYLRLRQNPDGGFGDYGLSNVIDTSMALMALIESGEGQALPLQRAVNYLLNSQLPDGSWDGDAYTTALALRALHSAQPNLTVASSDITYARAGSGITIAATIHNTGAQSASNVLVRFYDGDPMAGGVQIDGDQSIASIAAGGEATVQVAWDVSVVYGIHEIYKIIIDNIIYCDRNWDNRVKGVEEC